MHLIPDQKSILNDIQPHDPFWTNKRHSNITTMVEPDRPQGQNAIRPGKWKWYSRGERDRANFFMTYRGIILHRGFLPLTVVENNYFLCLIQEIGIVEIDPIIENSLIRNQVQFKYILVLSCIVFDSTFFVTVSCRRSHPLHQCSSPSLRFPSHIHRSRSLLYNGHQRQAYGSSLRSASYC